MHRVRLGVSSCLLGELTRYDGEKVTHGPLVRWLDAQAEVVSLCPEVGAMMPVPRPPIQLMAGDRGVRAVDRDTATVDMTDRLVGWAEGETTLIGSVDGVILKNRSPSCGVADTPIIGAGRTGAGIFVAWLMERFPDLPLVDIESWEDETRRAIWWGRVAVRASRRD